MKVIIKPEKVMKAIHSDKLWYVIAKKADDNSEFTGFVAKSKEAFVKAIRHSISTKSEMVVSVDTSNPPTKKTKYYIKQGFWA